MPSPVSLIQAKRDGRELSAREIRAFVQGVVDGGVAEYQASAFLMAVYFRGMTLAETVALTQAMVESGERYDLSSVPGAKVDKHSTGGVGDKVSLILAPLAAACGLKVPMMSGRGLGHSGGTLDKLESIPGFDVKLGFERFKEILSRYGCAMIGQSERIAPADRKLYALRDVTGTVECMPLIAASILSKKIAEGTDALVLDVKVGSGAFMKSKVKARELAKLLLQVSKKTGLKTRAVLSNMDQPLGYAVGNSLEVIESIEVLQGNGRYLAEAAECSSSDLKELTIQLCAQMLELGGVCRNLIEGRRLAHNKLADGSAWSVFKDLVKAQGGDASVLAHPEQLPLSKRVLRWKADKRGYIAKIDTESVGKILVELGGGRIKASDSVDPSVGLVFHKKLGAYVKPGDTIAAVFAPEKGSSGQETALSELEKRFQAAIQISRARKPVPKLMMEITS